MTGDFSGNGASQERAEKDGFEKCKYAMTAHCLKCHIIQFLFLRQCYSC